MKTNLLSKPHILNILVLLTGVVFMTGCAFTTQAVKLDPMANISSSNIGSGKAIGLKVFDERPEKGLGNRGSAYGAAAEISSTQNIAEVIYGKLSQGLQEKGFIVEPYNKGLPVSLVAEIRQIKYQSAAGLVTFTIQTNSAIKCYCNNGGNSYQDIYRGEVEEEWMVVPFAETNERIINESVAKTLEKIFQDHKLLECLASEA